MKKISVLFAALMLVVATGFVSAQKMATMDMASILSLMPEKRKADEQLKAFSDSKRAEIEKQMKAAQDLMKRYSEEAPNQTQQVNEQRGQELQKMEQNIQELQAAAQKDLAERTDAAYAPIEKKFLDAVDRAAKSNGWDYIFDANASGIIYKNGPDATAAVRKELGL